ncbi:MAG: TauD/TfdA family dioxygenase [Sphingobacteriales bacterium]|nr:MAG: TauD/TfdA family dioxygenase [Sphingobacteriales bacterium]
MNQSFLDNKLSLPLVIQPQQNASLKYLNDWIQENKQQIDANITKYGAVLFRGFDVQSPTHFEQIAMAVDNDLKNDYMGTSPRDKKTDYVFSASELPPHYPIMQHCEMSFLPSAPRRLFFYCHTAPPFGGETPICDFRKVYQNINPEIRREFEQKGVQHIRNYASPNSKSRSGFQLKSWYDMFHTDDKKLVESKCKEHDIICEWKENDGLRMTNKSSAFKQHPISNEMVWFNHTQVFHIDAAAIEYEYIHKRQKRWDTFKTNLFLDLMTWYKKKKLNPFEQSMHVTFGDGSEIPTAYVQHIQDVIWQNLSIYAWKKGDIICIDNFSTSHGRLPYYGDREVMVCWTS